MFGVKSWDGGINNGCTGPNSIHYELPGKVNKNGEDSICRVYDQYVQTIDHLFCVFSILISREHKDRYDNIM